MAQISENPDGLGYIVLYGTTDRQHVTYDEAKAAIDTHKLNGADLKPPTPSRAYTRAISAHESKDRFARKVDTDPAKKVVRFFRAEQQKGTEEIDFPKEDRVEFDKKTQSIAVEGTHGQAIVTNFEHFGHHLTGDDVRQLCRYVVEHRLDGISVRGSIDVRDAGGVYFVPIQHREQLQALANVLEALGVGYLRAFGVIRGTAEELHIALAAEFSIERQINDIAQAIEKLTSRVSSASAQRKELDRLSSILTTYANISGRDVPPDLRKKLDQAIVKADAKIAELTAKAEAARKVKKSKRRVPKH